MLLLIGFVLLLVLDSPWNWIAFFACVILTFEITFFWRRVRGRSGRQRDADRQAGSRRRCRPLGQVVVDGEAVGSTVQTAPAPARPSRSSAATAWCSWSRDQ